MKTTYTLKLTHPTEKSQEDYVFTVLQKTHGGQPVNLALINGGLEGKIKVFQSLLIGKTRHLDLFRISTSAFGSCFFSEDMVQYIHDI